jgi:chromosome partition protein MukE
VTSRFGSLEEVIQDPAFPNVDIALRRGRHIDRDDGDWYLFIHDAQDHLEKLYRRYGCELVTQSDGYFYLLPTGEQLSRRQLGAGEMLVGQTLALQYLDPATIQSAGVMAGEHLLTRLVGLVGDRELAQACEPRRRRFDDERVVHDIIRKRVAEAVRRLAALGFVELIDDERIRLRSPLLRFADPVRGLQDVNAAMERLIARGEVIDHERAESADADSDATDGSAEEGEDELDENDDAEDAEREA